MISSRILYGFDLQRMRIRIFQASGFHFRLWGFRPSIAIRGSDKPGRPLKLHSGLGLGPKPSSERLSRALE